MNEFQYYVFYSKSKEEGKTELEKVFIELIKKIELYEKQYDVTLKLYKSEWIKEIEKLRENYDKLLKNAKEIYDEAYDEMEGEDEQIRGSYAEHKSGLDILYYEHYEEKG